MAEQPIPEQELLNRLYIGQAKTGDNIDAIRVADYSYAGGGQWSRTPSPLLDTAYDYVAMSNPDGNGNYQTFTYKTGGSGGTTVRTLTYTYDGSSNVTSITRS